MIHLFCVKNLLRSRIAHKSIRWAESEKIQQRIIEISHISADMYSKKHCAAKLIPCVFKEKYRNEENRGKYKKTERAEQATGADPEFYVYTII